MAGPAGRDTALALTRRAIKALSQPFLFSDISVRIGASAGILVTDESQTSSANAASKLLEHVDRALYAAKRAGGSRWQWSDEETAVQLQTG